jgi:HlyD family secretion protein
VQRLFTIQKLPLGGALAAALVLVSACAQPAATPKTLAPTPAPIGVAVSADTAHQGDIQQTLSYSGDIRAREQINVLPKASGRIQQLLVDTGSQVKAGDTLAILDQDSAQLTAAQARAGLSAARAKLDTLTAGPRVEDVVAAQAGMAQQQTRLQNMRSGGRLDDIGAAQAGVSVTEAKLQALLNGADDGVRQAQQSAVDSDSAAVASAESAYAALGGQNAANLQAAQAQLDTLKAQASSAQAQIDSADAALNNVGGSSAADVQAAKSGLDQSQSQLRTAQAALKQANNPMQASIAEAQAGLEAARSQLSAAQANQTALEQNVTGACTVVNLGGGATVAHNSTACGEAKAAANASINAANAGVEAAQGQLDLLKRGGGPAAQAQLQAVADQAQAQVNATQARLDALNHGGVAAVRAQAEAQKQQAQGQLVQVQQGLLVAEANLAAAKNGNLDAQVKSASAQVTAARERLKSDQVRLEVLLRGPTDEDLQQAQGGIDQARQQLNKATLPYTGYDLQQQVQAVAQATAQLQKVQNPFTDQDFEAAQAGVDQAQAAVDVTDLGLRETTVTAPVDGVIAARLVSPGALVSPQSPIVTLVAPALELVVNVEEAQLVQVSVGQPVQLAVSAFPSQTFAGTVRSIAPTIDSKSRTAAVRIEPTDTANHLRDGMFATLSITTAEHHNTLLAPRQAILSGTPGVEPSVLAIDASGVVRRQPVKLGIQSDLFGEILSGIDDGQVVATSNLATLTDGEIVTPQLDTRTAYVQP